MAKQNEVTKKEKDEELNEGAELCPDCGSEKVWEEGNMICPDCDVEIDFFGDDEEDK